jgi:hypothetical protein
VALPLKLRSGKVALPVLDPESELYYIQRLDNIMQRVRFRSRIQIYNKFYKISEKELEAPKDSESTQ